MGGKKKKKRDDDNPVLASNRKASHEYHLLRRLEAGIVLYGPEVKKPGTFAANCLLARRLADTPPDRREATYISTAGTWPG